eukprot:TRINITY_DN1580_c0_g1_i7.p1 TRINITY_DN1580_c0_g1~~TRINITY_DN1580_c0_g1_i7.p1  ORF type:complete len:831 (+),score=190.31 TRINITY_DN1580_c0_g1_i7:83-2575(+)
MTSKLVVRLLCLQAAVVLVAGQQKAGGDGKTSMPSPPVTMVAATNFTKCLMSGKSRQQCASAAGTNVSAVPDAMKGKANALADKMKECTGTPESCREAAMEALKHLMGKPVGDEQVAGELAKAAAKSAGDLIRTCFANAATEVDKKACVNSTAAREQAAKISGQAASSITTEDLMKFARASAKSEITEKMQSCMEAAADATAKLACFEGVRSSVAGALGKGADSLKASAVQEFVQGSARDGARQAMESCIADGTSADTCKAQAKQVMSKTLGMANISDGMLEQETRKAMAEDLGDKMVACMTAATNASAKTACSKLARESLKSIGMEAGEPSAASVELALAKAAMSQGKELASDCAGSRDECIARMKEKMAMAMGASKLTEKDMETLTYGAATEAAKEAAKACRAAMKANSSATCDDPVQKFMDVTMRNFSGTPEAQAVAKSNVRQDVAKSLQKSAMSVCIQKSSRAAVESCMADLASDTQDVSKDMFKSLSQPGQDARQKRARKEAAVEVVGESFHECMKAASTNTAKSACHQMLGSQTNKAGLTEDVEDVATRFRGDMVKSAAKACSTNATQRAQCLRETKEELKQGGMKEREFAKVKKLAIGKAAAETWAACRENSSNTEAECDELAKTAFEDLHGAPGSWSTAAQKIKTLGQALLAGNETVLTKLRSMEVDAEMDGTACVNASGNRLIEKLGEVLNTTIPSDAKKLCLLVFDKATYGAKVPLESLNDTEIQAKADLVATQLQGVDLSARRLEAFRRLDSVDSIYADQEVEETTVSSGAPSPSPTSSPSSPSPSSSPSSPPATADSGKTTCFAGLSMLCIVAGLQLS